MRKQILSLLLVAVLGMTALSGCSSSTEESSGGNSSTESETNSVSDTKSETTPVSDAESEPSQSSDSQEPTYGGSVVVGIQQDIDSLDPHKATAAGTKEILFNIFEGLLKPDENGNLINAVASDYTISEDGLVYTFTLRDGVKFHNGNEVTAEDVKYSLERVSGLLDGVALISTLQTIQSVDILDEKTVQVTVDSANLELIYSFVAAIIPEGSGEDAEATPIGTGPFSFVSYTPQEGIVLKKFDEYWQAGLPYLDEVTFKIVASTDTVLMDLQAGSIDIYPYLTDSQASELQDSFQILSAASDVVQALFLNNAVEPLDNELVRQAICYALDKESVNDFVSGGNGTIISSGMLPTLVDYYEDLNDSYGNTANIEKAKGLLTEAGYPDGFDLEIMVPSNYTFHMETAEVVAEQLKAVGINATINGVEWETWLNDCYYGREYQATISGITCDMTPGYLLNRYQTESSKNFINFSDEEYDEVYLKAAASLDLTEKAGYYKRLQEILCEQAGSAFLQVPPITIAISPELSGYKFYPVYVQDMSTVYYVTQ